MTTTLISMVNNNYNKCLCDFQGCIYKVCNSPPRCAGQIFKGKDQGGNLFKGPGGGGNKSKTCKL